MLKINIANPYKRAFQFEYSLYRQIAMLFAKTSCRSMTADVQKGEYCGQAVKPSDITISGLLQWDVLGCIEFPMMSACHAEVHIRTLENGLHEFIFTDEIYTFSVSLRMDKTFKNVLGINVTV